VSAVAAGADITFLRPVPVGAELEAEAVQRALVGRSGLYDVTVRVGTEPVAEFRGRSRQVPGLAPPQ
jgi:acyl-CoA thioesterase